MPQTLLDYTWNLDKSELLWPHYLHDLAPVVFPTSFSLLSIHCQSLSALACFQFLQYQAEVCLRVPRRLSLASYLAPFRRSLPFTVQISAPVSSHRPSLTTCLK